MPTSTPTPAAAVIANKPQAEKVVRLALLLHLDAPPQMLAAALYEVVMAVADGMPDVGAHFGDLLVQPRARSRS